MVDSIIRANISTLADFLATNLPGILSRNQINTALINFMSLNPNTVTTLSTLKPDFESNKAELQSAILDSNDPIWNTAAIASVGNTFIETVATAETYNTAAALFGAREAFIQTARLPNSIYAGTRNLGVRIKRRVPANCPVTLSRSLNLQNSYVFAPYSVFSIGGSAYFNRNSIIIPAGQNSVNDVLYEGALAQTDVVSDGTAYQKYVVGNNDFTISDLDVICFIDGIVWSRTETDDNMSDGLWEYNSGDLVFSEDTTQDGNVEVSFGNNINGAIPPLGSTISIVYARTNGATANSVLIGQPITYGLDSTVNGTVLGGTDGGMEARLAQEYQILSPGKFSSKKLLVALPNIRSGVLYYPGGGIIDAYVRGQQDIAPDDVRYQMVLELTLLTTQPWSVTDQANFYAWFAKRGPANFRLIFRTAVPYPIDLSYNIYCKDQPALAALQLQITSNLEALFQLQAGSLGATYRKFDLENIIKQTDKIQVVSLTSISPTRDIMLEGYQYAVINSLSLNLMKE